MSSPMQFLRCYTYLGASVTRFMLRAPFDSKARNGVRRLAAAAGWRGLQTALPTCTLDELVAQRAPVRVDNSSDHEFNVSFYELFVISQLVAARQPRSIFEMGTFNGRTTLHLAMNSPADARVVTADLPADAEVFDDPNLVGSCYRDTPHAQKIVQLRQDTRRIDPSPYAGTMEFIFIDAGHEYDDVCNDTDLALRLAKPSDCLILWHDYSQWPDVQQALDERYATGERYRGLRHIRGTSMAVLDLTHQYSENNRRRSGRRAAAGTTRRTGV